MDKTEYLPERIGNLMEIPFRLTLTIYIIGVLMHLPGEIIAPFFLSYNIGWEVIGFQTVMVLSDGIGVLLIYLTVSIIRNDELWIEKEKQIPSFLLVIVLGFVIALVTEKFGVNVFNLWTYPASLKTFLGVACGAILGWTVLPTAAFVVIHRGYDFKSIILALLIIIGSNLFGIYFLA